MTERIISTSLQLLWMCLILAAMPAEAARDVREKPISKAVERHLPGDQEIMEWTYDPEALEGLSGDRVETFEVGTVEPNTVKLTNVVKPIHFESGVADIPTSTVDTLRTVLNDMRERNNVRLNFVGHADNERLSPRLAAIYGDNFGLSRERAGQVAEYFQNALELPADAVSYEWAGDTKPIASNGSAAGRARNRRVDVEVWYDELEDGTELEELVVVEQMERVKVCRIETVCKLRYVDGHERRARVLNLVAPLRYSSASIDVTPEFTMQVERTLQNLADKQNVLVKFVGFTDNQPLNGRTERIYGSHEVLCKARARRVALAIQDELGLATAAVHSDGRGATRPLASNDTIAGRALNRRVEVEFWYDDPLQDLPDEPQLCPDAPGAETVTKVYHPPWGNIAALQLDAGQPVVPAGYTDTLERALSEVADKSNARLRFVGYTRNERLDRRTASVYGDDIGLSAARARRTMETLSESLELGVEQAEFEGRGYLHSADVVNAGFIQGDSSYVAVQVVYDELAVLDDNEGLDITPLVRELEPKNPFALNMMRITVDGEPIDDPNRSSADVQRCTDVALKGVDIQFGFDNLTSSPRLSVAASPTVTDVRENRRGLAVGDPVRFKMYANYNHFIEYAEIRIFDDAQSTRAKPRYIVEVGADALAEWQPSMELFVGPVRELKYVLRAYGEDGSFDETAARPLWVVHENEVAQVDGKADVPDVASDALDDQALVDPNDPMLRQQLLSGYGENALAMHNIRLSSGTVRVQGSDVPEGHSVYVAGQPVPVDEQGNFVTEQILPTGAHTVEVALLDEQGSGESYLRDLEFEPSDWFYVGMADLTLSHNSTNGPMELLVGDNAPYDYDSSADGRLAFYVNGKFGNKWRLTASADTREEPLENLFTNFMNKSPDSLFRRIDPD
ncbi:MAG: OmpA family protein [Gammaproteobacteria bacterium]|nr:OmpA family protein [Gammaproteobacteria bacterium]